MANSVDSGKNQGPKGLTESNKRNDEDSDEDGASNNNQPPSRASFSMAYALNMLRRRKKTEKDDEEEKKEKAKAKRRRRRQNQRLAKAKVQTQISNSEVTTPIKSDLQNNKRRRKLKVPKEPHDSDGNDHNLNQTQDAVALDQRPPVKKVKLLIPRALLVKSKPSATTEPDINPQ